jgi:hypothetical protein
MRAQSGNGGEFNESELGCQLRVDIIEYTPHLSRSQPASVRDR